MNRLGLILAACLAIAWIVVSVFFLQGWTVNRLLTSIATWVDIPLGAWLCGVAWVTFRGKRQSRED